MSFKMPTDKRTSDEEAQGIHRAALFCEQKDFPSLSSCCCSCWTGELTVPDIKLKSLMSFVTEASAPRAYCLAMIRPLVWF